MIAQREYRLQGAEKLTAQADSIFKSMQLSPERQDCGISEGESIRCFAGWSQFWIAWNGEMTPCGMLDSPKTAPLTEGFWVSWEKIKQDTAKIRLCSDCITCEERDTCFNYAAVMHTETGSYEGRPDYMCRLNHAYREEVILLAEKVRSVRDN
jgi:MoaA/NifB/PqqE/SkfB family radical SAM enzyme